ncbi:MAG: hypothetical protein HC892_05435 [Saprospiraceae bacterium]|nr:hypothetical protein [Saprospiraceae bacterium]
MLKKVSLCLLIFLLVASATLAQTVLMRLAENYMENQEYEAAIEVYQKCWRRTMN